MKLATLCFILIFAQVNDGSKLKQENLNLKRQLKQFKNENQHLKATGRPLLGFARKNRPSGWKLWIICIKKSSKISVPLKGFRRKRKKPAEWLETLDYMHQKIVDTNTAVGNNNNRRSTVLPFCHTCFLHHLLLRFLFHARKMAEFARVVK